MTTLSTYLIRLRQLIGYDFHEAMFNDDDLIEFINTARDEVAGQGQCLRFVTPYQGSVVEFMVTAPGSGYVHPMVTVSPPDQPSGRLPYPTGATALGIAQQIGGEISQISVRFGGDGYAIPPIVTITDAGGPGEGASAIGVVAPINQALEGQEVYQFNAIDLSTSPQLRSILAVKGVSFIWGNWQWSANRVSLSRYMALSRQWTTNFFAPPEICCQEGQGTNGSLRLYPIPDQEYPMIWDCLCLPQPLLDNTTFEPIPEPWTKAVPYYAAHLALLSQAARVPQFFNLSQAYFNEKTGGLFNTAMVRARAFAQPGTVGSFYGRN